MPSIGRFEDIQAWQNAREITQLVYALSNLGDFSRDFSLRDQMRRSAVSIMCNIAEGFESRTQSLFIEFLGRAKGSSGELRSQAYIAQDIGYIDHDQFHQLFGLTDKCSRQIARFIQYLETQPNSRRIRENKIEYDV